MKLGDKIKVNKRFVRKGKYVDYPGKTLYWVEQDIPEIEVMITGVRIISDGKITDEGFIFEHSRRVYKVAKNLKEEFYTPIL